MKNLLKIAFVCLFALTVTTAQSQIRFGAKAGLNISNMEFSTGTGSYTPDSKVGFHVGGILEYSINDNLVLQPGLLFSTKGYKFSNDFIDADVSLSCLEIPINVMYKLDLGTVKVFGFAGPYLGYSLSGKSGDNDIEFGSGENEMNAMDFGLNFGAGAEFGQFQASLQYGLGLSNLSNEDSGKAKNKVIGISVAYLF
jgi:hypothetical protein